MIMFIVQQDTIDQIIGEKHIGEKTHIVEKLCGHFYYLHHLSKTKKTKTKNKKTPKRKFYIVMSGQFCTLGMFFRCVSISSPTPVSRLVGRQVGGGSHFQNLTPAATEQPEGAMNRPTCTKYLIPETWKGLENQDCKQNCRPFVPHQETCRVWGHVTNCALKAYQLLHNQLEQRVARNCIFEYLRNKIVLEKIIFCKE